MAAMCFLTACNCSVRIYLTMSDTDNSCNDEEETELIISSLLTNTSKKVLCVATTPTSMRET